MARASKYEDVREAILGIVAAAESSHGKAPTVRDLAGDHEVSASTMHSYLTKLREEGLIEWRKGRHRTVRLTPKGSQLLLELAG